MRSRRPCRSTAWCRRKRGSRTGRRSRRRCRATTPSTTTASTRAAEDYVGAVDLILSANTGAEPLLAHADPEWVARYQQISGYALGMLGRAAEARERFALAIEGARNCGDDDILVRALHNLPLIPI